MTRPHPLQLLARLVVAAIDHQQLLEPSRCVTEPRAALGDVGQRLERDHVFRVELQHVHERLLGGGVILEVEMTPAQHDAGWYVVGVKLEPGGQDADRVLRIA